MTQTNAIILRIKKDKTEKFEKLFEQEELPIWDDFVARKRFLNCSLTRVAFGSDVEAQDANGIVEYILHVEAKSMAAHSEHDRDERFNAFLKKAQQLQPGGPSVWGGTTLFQRNSDDAREALMERDPRD